MSPPPQTPKLTVDTVVVHQGKVLLIRRGQPPFAGSWALPGGFVDLGETVEAAAVRETREETGLEVTLEGLVGVFSDPDRDPRGHQVSVVFMARPTNLANVTVRGGDDASDAAWHRLDALPALAFDHAKVMARAARHMLGA